MERNMFNVYGVHAGSPVLRTSTRMLKPLERARRYTRSVGETESGDTNCLKTQTRSNERKSENKKKRVRAVMLCKTERTLLPFFLF
jgi:hypothetical protein